MRNRRVKGAEAILMGLICLLLFSCRPPQPEKRTAAKPPTESLESAHRRLVEHNPGEAASAVEEASQALAHEAETATELTKDDLLTSAADLEQLASDLKHGLAISSDVADEILTRAYNAIQRHYFLEHGSQAPKGKPASVGRLPAPAKTALRKAAQAFAREAASATVLSKNDLLASAANLKQLASDVQAGLQIFSETAEENEVSPSGPPTQPDAVMALNTEASSMNLEVGSWNADAGSSNGEAISFNPAPSSLKKRAKSLAVSLPLEPSAFLTETNPLCTRHSPHWLHLPKPGRLALALFLHRRAAAGATRARCSSSLCHAFGTLRGLARGIVTGPAPFRPTAKQKQ